MKTPSFGSTGVSSILSTGGCVVEGAFFSAIVGLRTLLSHICTEVVDNTVISHRLIHTGNVMKHSKQVIIEKRDKCANADEVDDRNSRNANRI